VNEQALTPVPIAESVEPIAKMRCKRIPGFSYRSMREDYLGPRMKWLANSWS